MCKLAYLIFGPVKQKPEISQCSQVTSEAAVTLRESYTSKIRSTFSCISLIALLSLELDV